MILTPTDDNTPASRMFVDTLRVKAPGLCTDRTDADLLALGAEVAHRAYSGQTVALWLWLDGLGFSRFEATALVRETLVGLFPYAVVRTGADVTEED